MADHSSQSRELVFCHVCQNEWHQDEHGLRCPACNSTFVELIEEGNDPRDSHTDDVEEVTGPSPDQLPRNRLHTTNPFHNHNPWGPMAPDPEEGDISHVEWNPTPGIHFSRTSYRTTSPGRIRIGASGPQGIQDPFAQIFQNFSSILGGPSGFNHAPPNAARSPPGSPRHARNTHGHDTPPLRPRDAHNAQPNAFPVDNLQGLLGNLLRGMQEMHGDAHASPQMPPLHLFAQILNPANAQHGDAVYSEEALDRIISQFMEAQSGHSAPGPASAAAIAALPKKKVDESMLGSDGKAECSVCMDNVSVGDDVTVLPCSHWFHGECVGAWLKEHDTCPHCRQGIMPKSSESGQTDDAPRQPGQAPRNSQPPLSPGQDNGFRFAWHQPPSGNHSTSPNQQEPHSPSSRHESRSRRRSARNGAEGSSGGSGTTGGGGGLSGWVRSHFGGNNHD